MQMLNSLASLYLSGPESQTPNAEARNFICFGFEILILDA